MCVRVRLSLDLPWEWFDAVATYMHSQVHSSFTHSDFMKLDYSRARGPIPPIEARLITELLRHFFAAKCWNTLLVPYVSCTSLESIFLSLFLRSFARTFFNFPSDKAATSQENQNEFCIHNSLLVCSGGWVQLKYALLLCLCSAPISLPTHTRLLCRTRDIRSKIYWADVRNYTSLWIMSEMHTRTFAHSLTRALIVLRNTNKMWNMCAAHKLCLRSSIWTPPFEPLHLHMVFRVCTICSLRNESTKLS